MLAIGWIAFGVTALAFAVLALRFSGVRADLLASELHRKQTEQDLRDLADASKMAGLYSDAQIEDLAFDVKEARDALDTLYRSNPGAARARLDRVLQKARRATAGGSDHDTPRVSARPGPAGTDGSASGG